MFTKLAIAALVANVSASDASVLATKYVKMAQAAEGVTKPFGVHFNVEAFLACVGEEDKAALIFDAIYQMVQEAIQTKQYGELLPAIIFFFAGINQVKQGIPACEASFSNVAPFRSAITQITEDKMDLIKIINEIAVAELLKKFISHFENNNLEAAGEVIGNLIKEIQEKKSTFTAPVKANKRHLAETAQGFLKATNVGDFNLQALLVCIYEADQEAEVLDAVYHMIKQAIENRDWQEGVGAVIGIVAFIQGLKQVVGPCSHVDASNWTVVDQITSELAQPEELMKIINENVVLNGKTITKELMTATSAYESGNYNTFGQEIGAVMKDTCTKNESLFLY